MLKGLTAAVILLLTVSIGHAAPAKGDKAPDFRAAANRGPAINLSDYRGRIVILDFFATWCTACSQAAGFLVEIDRKYKGGGLKIVALDVEDTGMEKIDAYIRKKGIDYPVVSADDRVQQFYGVTSLPLLYIIDRDGIIVGRFQGFSREIAVSIEQLIKSNHSN